MTNKKFWTGMLVFALAFGMLFISCSDDENTDITYTATANGTANTVTTTQLSFTFSAAVSGLTAENITITAGTGSASKGTLTGSDASWTLSVTGVTAGTIKVKINKAGIESDEKTVTVNAAPATITYTVTANGTADTVNTTQLSFTFSAAVSGLTATDITITDGTGSASKGTLTGSGTSWNLNINTVNTAGTIKVKIVKTGIESDEKTVTIHKIVPNGSSRELAIPLSDTQWENGSVATGGAKWYKFQSTSTIHYGVQWKDMSDKPASDDYTASVKVTAYESNGTTIISAINGSTSGYTSPKTIYMVIGTVYLKVEPTASSAGTYAIRFYNVASVVPQIPMSISSVSATPASVVVTWNYSVSSTNGVSGYRVYRSSTETGTYTKIGADITDLTTRSYTDTNVSAGSTYWYKVAAYNSVGEGDKSAVRQSIVPNTTDITSLTIGATATQGSLSTVTQVNWYKFTATSTTTYYVHCTDSYSIESGSSYTASVRLSAFESDGITPITDIQDVTVSSPRTVSGVNGTVYYLKVAAPNIPGTYCIKVSTSLY